MRNSKLLLCFLCVLGGSVFARALDREAFTFTDYQLNVNIDPPKQFFSATGMVALRNDSLAPQHIAVLQISSSLNWKLITVDHKPVQYLTHGYTSDVDHTGELSEAVVTLPHDVAPQGTVQLEVAYEGTIAQNTTRLERIGITKAEARKTDWDEISSQFTAVRGLGYVAWYPVAMEAVSISQSADFSIALERWKQRHAASTLDCKVTAPLGYANLEMNDLPKGVRGGGLSAIVASNYPGKGATQSAQKTISFSGNSKTWSWTDFRFDPLGTRAPMFFSVSMNSTPAANASIHLLQSGRVASEIFIGAATRLQPLTQEWFDANSGAGRRLQIYQLLDTNDVPYESDWLYFTPLNANPDSLQIALAHPLAHVFIQSSRHWIYQGFANFFQALAREKQDGRKAALNYMGQQLPAIEDDEKENLALAQAARSGPFPSIAYTSLIGGHDELLYRSKAMYVWWMLRDMLGDVVVQRALAKYRPDDDKQPSYLQHLLEAEAKAAGNSSDLEQFFDDWIYYDRGLPDFRVDSTYVRRVPGSGQSANTYLVTVTIENLGNAGAEVPVTLVAANKERVSKRLLVKAHDKAAIRITMQNRPDSATVNDGSVPESDTSNNTAPVTADAKPAI